MQPKILEAINRIFYIMLHPNSFDETLIPIIICILKCFTEFYLELMCLFLTSKSETVHECIMDFVALGVISELDERYFDSLKDPLKDKMSSDEVQYKLPIMNIKKREVDK